MNKVTFSSRELNEYLDQDKDILALYLYGSKSIGIDHPRSDVDLALLLKVEVDRLRYSDYRLKYLSKLNKFFKGKLDLVVLNQVSPLLQFQVLQKGTLLYDRNPDRRAELEIKMLNRYYISKRFYEFHFDNLIHRIKECGLGHGPKSVKGSTEEAGRISEKLTSF
jgi:hypothetical protein